MTKNKSDVFTLLVLCGLAAASPGATAATITTVAAIPGFSDGNLPTAGLTLLDGKYYGTTYEGGATSAGAGIVYRIDLKSGAETILHSFNGASDGGRPDGNLIAVDGTLYGTTTSGGSAGGGTVFAIDPATGAEQVLWNLPANTNSQFALVAFHGLLYGTGRTGSGSVGAGLIFSVDPVAATGQVLYSFMGGRADGSFPVGLTIRNAALFGATSAGGENNSGTVFQFDPMTRTLRREYSFAKTNDGNYPRGSLTNVGGVLYGTTWYGGASGNGIVYSFNPEGRQETVVHSFNGTDGTMPSSSLLNVGGLLYGVTQTGGANRYGTLFSIDPATGTTDTIYNFAYPGTYTDLVDVGGVLYGTMYEGGVVAEGSVYAVDPATSAFRTVYSFVGPEMSYNTGVIKVGTSLIGAAPGGGSRGLGSIYKVDPATGAVDTLYSFSGADGLFPSGALVNIGGVLYGTTTGGGAAGYGTVFSFGSASHKLTTLYGFTGGADGSYPYTISQDNGILYGPTGGGRGTVFKFDTVHGSFSTVYSFASPDYGPSGVIVVNGLLYGEIYGGFGTLFQIDPASGSETTVYSFHGKTDGELPTGGLLYSNGALFGTTDGDGKRAPATMFRFDLATGTKSTIYSSVKVAPQAPLVASGKGLYGVAYSHDATYGAVLHVNATDGAAHINPFASAAGGYPEGALLRVGNAYYGTTRPGDPSNAGTVFKFVP